MQEELQKKIEQALDERVRPALHDHGGDVVVTDFADGVLKIRMTGRCSNCPSATITTEQLIEKEMTEALPEIKRVVLITQVSDELLDMARAILEHRMP